MARTKAAEPLKLGDRVKILHTDWRGQIIELRGPLGPRGMQVYRVRVKGKPKPADVEVCEDQLALLPTPQAKAPEYFFKVGLEYYIAGRAAAAAHLSLVTGNLLHHAVEMLLEGELARTTGLDDLKAKYGHRLLRAWDAVKKLHAAEDLAGFDQVITDLDHFEKIRYPDDILSNGAQISVGWGNGPTQRPATPPLYSLDVNAVDKLVARLARLFRINPPAYLGGLNPEARRALEFLNEECQGW
jgi:hypothetical protein